MTRIDLGALETAAGEAIDGPWALLPDERALGWVVAEGDEVEDEVSVSGYQPDAAHIANMDPPTSLALIRGLRDAHEALAGIYERGAEGGIRKDPIDRCKLMMYDARATLASLETRFDFDPERTPDE